MRVKERDRERGRKEEMVDFGHNTQYSEAINYDMS